MDPRVGLEPRGPDAEEVDPVARRARHPRVAEGRDEAQVHRGPVLSTPQRLAVGRDREEALVRGRARGPDGRRREPGPYPQHTPLSHNDRKVKTESLGGRGFAVYTFPLERL